MADRKNENKKPKKESLEDLTADFSTDGSEISFGEEDQKPTESQEENNVTPISATEDSSPTEEATEGGEVEKLKQDLLYLKAEFENFKKRTYKEKSDLIKYGPERLAVEVLSVVDIFDMALGQEVTAEKFESFKEGMDMTYKQLITSLNKFGVEEISSLGEPFDPTIHEALSNQPTEEYPPDHVCVVFKKGYKFFDKIIRPAQVVVSKPLDPES